ncbi:MAG: hypothetical protein CME06_00310 [Gemmatimonadetes bacterium]|nr:hypothetical protein [Gemmatimonadota bacterium]
MIALRDLGNAELIARLRTLRKRTSAPRNVPQPSIGELLDGRYRLERRYFLGVLSSSYLATDIERGEAVTLHLIHYEDVGDSGFKQWAGATLAEECEKATLLRHENIVRTLSHRRHGDLEFLITEKASGRPFAHVLERLATGRVAPNRAVLLGIQILKGLEYAHGLGAVHGCLDIDTVLLVGSDEARIAGFGMRALLDPRDEMKGVLDRRYPCSSPECIRGEAPTPRSDIYSVAATLFVLMDSAPPFGTNGRESRLGHMMFQLPLSPRIPPELHEVIEKGMNKDPRGRFRGAAELRLALASAAGIETEAVAPERESEKPATCSAPPDNEVTPHEEPPPPTLKVIGELSDRSIVESSEDASAPPLAHSEPLLRPWGDRDSGLDECLEKIVAIEGVIAAALVDGDGLVARIRGKANVDFDTLGSAVQLFFVAAIKATERIKQEDPKLVLAENASGMFLLVPLARGFVLAISADASMMLGALRYDVKALVPKLCRLLA